jgi:hypothetical protein
MQRSNINFKQAGQRMIIASTVFMLAFSVSARGKIDYRPCLSRNWHQDSLSQLLSLYYQVKNALVNSDPTAASAKAAELLKAINSVDVKALTPSEKKAYPSFQYKLEYDARHIAEVKDLSHQRQHFITLSQNMYALAKSVKLSGQPVYEQYCPMKDAYWLSNETAIRNPYYGNNMLTCGQVKDTLK